MKDFEVYVFPHRLFLFVKEVVSDMDEHRMNRLLLEKVGKKFYGHDKLISKYVPQILPAASERAYNSLVNSYMGILREELLKELPNLKEAYREELHKDSADKIRTDSISGIIIAVATIFTIVKNNIVLRVTRFNLEEKLAEIAVLNRKMSTNEWARCIRNTLGVDIRKDYYLGDFYSEELAKWVSDNVNLIKTIPEDTLDKMKDIVLQGYADGKTATEMAKQIQIVYGISKKRAKFIAADQTAKLNGDIQRAQQLDAGITEYEWRTTGDESVRKSHRALHGKRFSWNDAPLNSDGRKCHPGQDFRCRCRGNPIFNIEALNFPIKDDDVKATFKK